MKNVIAFLFLTLLAYSGMRFIDGGGQDIARQAKIDTGVEEWEQNLVQEKDEVKKSESSLQRPMENIQREKSWEEARQFFLIKTLSVKKDKIDELDQLRNETIEREKILVSKDVPMNDDQYIIRDIFEVKENRRHYEDQMASILGADDWKKYVQYYKEYWDLGAGDDLSKLYHPLK